MKANYQDKSTKIKASLACSELHQLSSLGKMTVLKSWPNELGDYPG